MPTTMPTRSPATPGSQRLRSAGYLVAAAINAVFLWIVHRLLDWEWPGFLTEEFDELLPLVTLSLVVSIVANVVYAWNDGHPIKTLGELTTTVVGLVVAVRTHQVFPFDFSTYDTDWSWLVRLVIIVAIVGSAIGIVVQSVKLLRGASSDRVTSR